MKFSENYNLYDIVTPIIPEKLEELLLLTDYDPREIRYLVDGFTNGFSLDYQGPRDCRQFSNNLKLRCGNKTDLWNKVMKEVELKRVCGPYTEPMWPWFHQSPLGLVPKSGSTVGETRLIFHLSHPRQLRDNDGLVPSVNAGTPSSSTTVQYNSVDDCIRNCLKVLQESDECYLARSDCSQAFRQLPIRVQDRPCLVMMVENPDDKQKYYFCDLCLPFGHAASCKIYSRFSSAVAHIFNRFTDKEDNFYLDDHQFCDGSKTSCDDQIVTFLQICQEINLPISPDKTLWGSQIMIFLGMLINTITRTLSIPAEKVQRAVDELLYLIHHKKTTVLQIQKNNGFTQFPL